MLGSDLILSDSGGMQEEAAALGVPLLILREKTERPEAIACGNLELIGTDPDKILAAVKKPSAVRCAWPRRLPSATGGRASGSPRSSKSGWSKGRCRHRLWLRG